MKKLIQLTLISAALAVFTVSAADNVLTDAEKNSGWKLLFDGTSLDQFQSLAKPEIGAGWTAADGTLSIGKASRGGDIITKEKFTNFEFAFEFRVTKGANSGVKYNVDPKRGSSGLGYEFQVLDDDNHPDAKLGRGCRTVGSLYDVLPAPKDKKVMPVGEWNSARIVATATHVEHWLNGTKTIEYDRGSDALKAAVALSKFAKTAGFAEWNSGHILLQDHNDAVSYRNLKIRPL